jgi:hypothetical protein
MPVNEHGPRAGAVLAGSNCRQDCHNAGEYHLNVLGQLLDRSAMGNVEALHQIMVLGVIPGPCMPGAQRVVRLVRVVVYFLVVIILACATCLVDSIKLRRGLTVFLVRHFL